MWRRVPCEQQLNMGQSVLRNRRRPFQKLHMLFQGDCKNNPKGNWVNIPKLRHGDRPFGVKCGNANKLGNVGVSPGKSFLFFVRCATP
jgi:hypothetical protein